MLLIQLLAALSVQLAAEAPQNLRCEWEANPEAVRDPRPEFYWETPSQSAFRIAVAAAPDGLANPLWEAAAESKLPIIAYGGPLLENGKKYYWRLQVRGGDGQWLADPPIQHFTMNWRPMPHYLPSVRTFVNFAGDPDWAKDKIDLCFRRQAKQGRGDILAVQYSLVCTMVIPSEKAADLQAFCQRGGHDFEACFCHFAKDARVTLHVGAERAENPRQERLCPGWDPRNDRNADGRVDEDEAKTLANPAATARERKQARIPIYFWGPPRDDFVMNVGHPGYQEFMAEEYTPRMAQGYDGIYFDTVPPQVAGPGRNNAVVEYPRQGDEADRWMRDLQLLFAKIKIRRPKAVIVANNWRATPMVIDGFQAENWQNITYPQDQWRRQIEEVRDYDRSGKIQLIQYNPIYNPEFSEFGSKVDGVSYDRDKIYGLATYYLAHGDFSYFGFGQHPYAHVMEQWFKAIEYDIGQPQGEYYVLRETERSQIGSLRNLLANGGFEEAGENGTPAAWTTAAPIRLDSAVRRSDAASAAITSDSVDINNINLQYVKLKPHTTYTLTVWIKSNQVAGSPGVQVYPYDFRGASGVGQFISVQGTSDWTRYRQTFRTGDDGEGRINFRMFGATGSAWFDDFQLVEGAQFTETIFARRFTKGLVLVRPYAAGGFGDDTASQVPLPRLMRPLSADGAVGEPATHVRLRNGEAVILCF